VSFVAITLCVASQRVFVVASLSTQSGNFWIHPRTKDAEYEMVLHNFVRYFPTKTKALTLCSMLFNDVISVIKIK
jgi:hypothetical protein